MDISVMFLKLNSLKIAPQAAELGMLTDTDDVVATVLGCQRTAGLGK